jgi:hypothetical protein
LLETKLKDRDFIAEQKKVDSVEECGAACLDFAGCQGFSYTAAKRKCLLSNTNKLGNSLKVNKKSSAGFVHYVSSPDCTTSTSTTITTATTATTTTATSTTTTVTTTTTTNLMAYFTSAVVRISLFC